ncbi:hypothetical protein MtrunA17_Chr4g0051741 [Medicago truncatula]|uniref:Uncharacterized protein n=1 Tax=Medicago truncatula TaxID=3880 RepID=A0A396IIU8_MEDTR|nr:hypothetical protein MtrunA17_Chr4g0051741 [Medicago truncatula]
MCDWRMAQFVKVIACYNERSNRWDALFSVAGYSQTITSVSTRW